VISSKPWIPVDAFGRVLKEVWLTFLFLAIEPQSITAPPDD
jgi:hypothetical protein